MGAQIGVAADPGAPDEGLRRGGNTVPRLEGIDLLARGQPVILDLIAELLQQVFRFETPGTSVLVHDHAVERGALV